MIHFSMRQSRSPPALDLLQLPIRTLGEGWGGAPEGLSRHLEESEKCPEDFRPTDARGGHKSVTISRKGDLRECLTY